MRRAALMMIGLALAGCSAGGGQVEVDAPDPQPAAAPVCRRLVEALPDVVAGQQARSVAPSDALAAAWGDPPVVLRCGVGRPPERTRAARCDVINRVGWFARRTDDGYLFTTIGRVAVVEVSVPDEYAPAGNALVDLARAIRTTVPLTRRCV